MVLAVDTDSGAEQGRPGATARRAEGAHTSVWADGLRRNLEPLLPRAPSRLYATPPGNVAGTPRGTLRYRTSCAAPGSTFARTWARSSEKGATGHLPRTPSMRSSQGEPSTSFGE